MNEKLQLSNSNPGNLLGNLFHIEHSKSEAVFSPEGRPDEKLEVFDPPQVTMGGQQTRFECILTMLKTSLMS